MQNQLGLMGDQAIMFSIMVALGIGGILALFMAIFWPKRWQVSYRMEVYFAVLIGALGVYGALNSQSTAAKYWADVPDIEKLALQSGNVGIGTDAEAFDRAVTAYLFQWGFIFINPDGSATRNALAVKPGERVLVHVLANDVIHGLQIPAARFMTEVDPGAVRSIWFRAPEKPGKYLIQCVNYCGIGHHQMKAWLVVGDGKPAPEGKKHG